MRLDERGAVSVPVVRAAAHRFRAIVDLQRPRRRLCAPSPLSRPRRPLHLRGLPMTLETWTPERVEQLRSFVVTGLSCSQIAAEIGVTRNAVIGKIHRLGLSPGRPPGASARSCPPRARRPRAAGQRTLLRLLFTDGAPAAEPAPATAAVDSEKPCSLVDLEHGKCRWPIADSAGERADFVFCGNEAAEGFSYCAGHARIAYRVPVRRRA